MFQTDEYIKLSRQILQVAPAVRIFLLGKRMVKYSTMNIFCPNFLNEESTDHYYLLVLIKRNHDASNNSVQDRIETTCLSICPVTAIVLDFEQFNQWLQEGHDFAYQVSVKATLLFEDLSLTFGDIKEVNLDAVNASRKAAQSKGLNLMQEFLAGADLYRIRQQNKMAAFMLHQAAEFALHAILKISIGLCVNSHNLDKLIRYCSLANINVTKVFNRHIENEIRLLHLLQRAYIETRYKETYCINTPDLLEITSKIRLLQEILLTMKCYT
jgi:uncharacterized protein